MESLPPRVAYALGLRTAHYSGPVRNEDLDPIVCVLQQARNALTPKEYELYWAMDGVFHTLTQFAAKLG